MKKDSMICSTTTPGADVAPSRASRRSPLSRIGRWSLLGRFGAGARPRARHLLSGLLPVFMTGDGPWPVMLFHDRVDIDGRLAYSDVIADMSPLRLNTGICPWSDSLVRSDFSGTEIALRMAMAIAEDANAAWRLRPRRPLFLEITRQHGMSASPLDTLGLDDEAAEAILEICRSHIEAKPRSRRPV